MPVSDARVRVAVEGQRIGYPISQAWVPLPPGITALPAAPAPVPDLTYGEVLTPTALLRPYQESIRVDCVLKVQMTQRRLEYALTLPQRIDTFKVKAFAAGTAFGPYIASSLIPRVQLETLTDLAWTPDVLPNSMWVDASRANRYQPASGPAGWIYEATKTNAIESPSGFDRDAFLYQGFSFIGSPDPLDNAQNGLRVARFINEGYESVASLGSDDGNNLLGYSATNSNSVFGFTIVIIAKPTNIPTNFSGSDYTRNGALWRFKQGNHGLYLRSNGRVGFVTTNGVLLQDDWNVNEWKVAIVTGSSAGFSLQLNDNPPVTTSATGLNVILNDKLEIGRSEQLPAPDFNWNYINMDFAEIITLKRVVTPEEASTIGQYAYRKWGFSSGDRSVTISIRPSFTYLPPIQKTSSMVIRSRFLREFSMMSLAPSAWLDASDASTTQVNSGAVIQWDDKSGNNNDLVHTPVSGSYDPSRSPVIATAAQNGLNVLRFDGVNDRLQMSVDIKTLFSFTGGDSFEDVIFNFTLVVVVKPTSVTTNSTGATSYVNNDTIWSMSNGNGSTTLPNSLFMRTASGGRIASSVSMLSPWTVGTCRIAILTGTTPTTLYINNDLAQITATESFSSGYSGTFANRLRFGENLGLTNYIGMDLCEVVAFPRVITATERSEVVDYLAGKWGVTV
jgi:hypothetical protein